MSSPRRSGTSADQRAAGALAVLRLVHEQPRISRSEAAAILGLSSSSMTEITARLRARDLLAEQAPTRRSDADAPRVSSPATPARDRRLGAAPNSGSTAS